MAMQESPRLSFSNDVCPSPTTFRIDDDDDSFSASAKDFDFSTSLFDYNYSPADLLFSKGKLLPLRNNSSSLPPIPNPNYCQRKSTDQGAAKTVCPFPRSKSAGSTKSGKKLWKSSSSKAYYYSRDRRLSCGNIGVRIDPVINVPAPFIPRGGSSSSSSGSNSGGGFFAYLLCNCRDKTFGMNEM